MDEPSENLDWRRIEISAQEGLRIAHPRGIAHQHPADRRRRQSGMIPDRRSSRDLEQCIAHRHTSQGIDSLAQRVVFVFEHSWKSLGSGRPFDWPSVRAVPGRRCGGGGSKRFGVKPQPRDETGVTANCGEQIERREAASATTTILRSGSQRRT